MPVRRDLSPTHLLRAFSVLARTRNFGRTAAELGLTQSAVSQRIAALEARLDVRLFDRQSSALTNAGEAYLEAVVPLLEQLAAAEERVASDWSRSRKNVVRLSIVPSYARCWLMPRLSALTMELREISLYVHATDARVSLDDGEFDLAIRVQPTNAAAGDRMTREEDVLVAVAPPTMVKSAQADPFQDTVLFDDDCGLLGVASGHSWQEWYSATGYERRQTGRMVQCSDAGLIVEAVRNGAGAALVRRSLVQGDLESGHLVQGGPSVASAGQTVLLQRPKQKRSRAATSVARWLSEEAISTST
ncbi:LysR family glycine cleavage system transcriptional activator [Bradyrhizobium sp. USDA 372]